jgi:DNA-binding CsgD family transcriptional regulator
MKIDIKTLDLFDQLNVGVSIVTWRPEDPPQMKWVFVNKKRCSMVGRSKADFMSTPPFDVSTRETRAQIEAVNMHLGAMKHFTIETTLIHKSHKAIPVTMHMNIIESDEGDLLMTEHHDLGSIQDMESKLDKAQDRVRNIMMLIEREKRQLAENIRGNLSLVSIPLINHLRAIASGEQKEILDILENRIRHVTRRLGITPDTGVPGTTLTRRQILICEMIRDGKSSKEIALVIGCSPSTINNHRNVIRKKLGLDGKSVNLQAFLNNMPSGTEGQELDFVDKMLDDLI